MIATEARLDWIAWCYRLVMTTIWRFVDHDGWAIASHIALSALLALFPFFIVVTAIASLFGSGNLADEVAKLLFQAWPAEVADPISGEIRRVLTTTRSDALTVGAVLAVYFASNGVEALRIGLNRAYRGYEWRPWYVTRLESILYVIFGAASLLVFAFLVVLGPILWNAAVSFAPAIEPLRWLVTLGRFVIAAVVIVIALLIAHLWLPGGYRRFWDVLPGIALTMALWLIGGTLFGYYLEDFGSRGYITTYAGLASGMIALVFLYVVSAIFLVGGELNAALADERQEANGIPSA